MPNASNAIARAAYAVIGPDGVRRAPGTGPEDLAIVKNAGGGSAFDQSLNTTNNVQFHQVNVKGTLFAKLVGVDGNDGDLIQFVGDFDLWSINLTGDTLSFRDVTTGVSAFSVNSGGTVTANTFVGSGASLTGIVKTVASRTGNVTLTPADVGLTDFEKAIFPAFYARSLITGGTGTMADPFTGAIDRITKGRGIAITLTPPGTYWSHTNAVSISNDTWDGFRLEGNGCTIMYTGAGTVQTQLDIAGSLAGWGLNQVHIRDLVLNGGTKVKDGIQLLVAHLAKLSNIRCLKGTAWALRVKGCTLPTVDGFIVSDFYNDELGEAQNNSGFAGGILVESVPETGNATSMLNLRNVDVRGVSGTVGISLNGCFNTILNGVASEANPNGMGLFIGTNASNTLLLANDYEANGANLPADGGGYRMGIWNEGPRTTIIGNQSFDTSIYNGPNATNLLLQNVPLNGACTNLGSHTTLINCNNSRAMTLDTPGNTDAWVTVIGDLTANNQMPETTVYGRGTSGAVINNSWYNGYTIAVAGASFADQTQNFGLHQDTNCNTTVAAKTSLAFNVGNAGVMGLSTNAATLNVPLTVNNGNVTISGTNALVATRGLFSGSVNAEAGLYASRSAQAYAFLSTLPGNGSYMGLWASQNVATALDTNYSFLARYDNQVTLFNTNGTMEFRKDNNTVMTMTATSLSVVGAVSASNLVRGVRLVLEGPSITTGTKGGLVTFPVAGTITKYTFQAETAETGSISVDVKKGAYNAARTSIVGSNPAVITAANHNQDSTLTGWSKTVNAGDVFELSVNSVSGFTSRVSLDLEIKL